MIKPKLADGFEGQRFLTIPPSVVEKLIQSPVSRDLYLSCIGYFPHARFHYVCRARGCPEYILIYVKDGCGWVEVAGTRFSLSHDEFIVIPKGVAHAYGSDEVDPWSIYWLHFDGNKATCLAEGLAAPTRIAPADNSRIAERLELFEEICFLLNKNLNVDVLDYANLVLQHLLGTFRYVNVYRKGAYRKNKENNAIGKVIHYMEENVENRLTVEEMAAVGHLSRSHFYRRFQEETGLSPLDYFIRLKVNKACLLLIDTPLSIGQIAYKLGFSDSQYFARTFKKITGVSAGHFRSRYINELPR